MPSLLIHHLGRIVSGELEQPIIDADTVFVEDGVIREIGTNRADADVLIDARGLTLIPGLIDGHSHPIFGDYAPPQHTIGWMRAYLHGGVTTLVSAGELHLPGLPLDPPDPKTFRYLAVLARRCTRNYRPGGLKVVAGTLLAAPGLREEDFDELAAEGISLIKFIFYPLTMDNNEAQQYVAWAHARGMRVKLHSGGVSRSGVSRPAGARVVKWLQPDIVGHCAGGPIPMPLEELEEVVRDTTCWLELATSGNFRLTVETVRLARKYGALHRLTLGTDTPGGTGIVPRGMLRNVLLLASLGGLSPEEALCVGTGSTARAHGLDSGRIAVGCPADLVLMGRIAGSVGEDALGSIAVGDLPGISCVIVDGELLVAPRSEQTPPPDCLAVVERRA